MVPNILLVSFVLHLIIVATSAGCSSEPGVKELENVIENLEFRLKAMEVRLNESERRAQKASEDKGKELPNNSQESTELAKSSLRDLPFVLISAYQPTPPLKDNSTVTFSSFLANYTNAGRPGGGEGAFDLSSGIFLCLTPGYYTVSFSAGIYFPSTSVSAQMHLQKNGDKINESTWIFQNQMAGASYWTGSRIVIVHMGSGDTLELVAARTSAQIHDITFNIELSGPDYLV